MSEQLSADVVGRLEEAILNVDSISLKVAGILRLFDRLFFNDRFRVDEFESEVMKEVKLSRTEVVLLRRAIDELRTADKEARMRGTDPDFLRTTTMDLGKYSVQPVVAHYPLMPGVVIIHLRSEKDAIQFDMDSEPAVIKALRKAMEEVGADIKFGSRPWGNFIGKLVAPESLGLPAESSFRVIALVGENMQEIDSAGRHEYLHFIEKIVYRYFHRYFGSTELLMPAANVERLERIPQVVRTRLVASIGPLKKANPTLSEDPDVDTEADPTEIFTTLQHERQLLDEMRAYCYGNGFIVPAQMQTTGLTFDQKYFSKLGKFDILMAKRYFEVQLRMLSLWIRGNSACKQGLAVLGATLSLSQATRLLDKIIGNTPLDMNDEQIRGMIGIIRNEGGRHHPIRFLDYKIGDTELISPEEVARYVPELTG